MLWTVDLGQGYRPVTLPHVWGRETDVRWVGPASYRTTVALAEARHLRFQGVAYRAQVFVDGEIAVTHDGIWDAFDVPLALGEHEIEVRVTKNGGATFPVKSVLSGFLPYVFHTFGGIFRPVDLVSPETPLVRAAAPTRIRVEKTRLFYQDEPYYVRGTLTWGWYPDAGHPNPDQETIQREVAQAWALGFNLVKFCLWLPPHAYLEELNRHGMTAWIELPLWAPRRGFDEEAALDELRRIVQQYRHHPNVILWTGGCELGSQVSPEFRQRLTAMIREETGCPLVKDNSGGSEMYEGDLREYGTFVDLHPYADTHHFPPLLDSLQNGPRQTMPVLLGEFDDYDVHRDLLALRNETPYWASSDPSQNDQGVRWQYDLPSVLANLDWLTPERNQWLMRWSEAKAMFIRRYVHDHVRMREDFTGYVVTGWRDTPISSSGMTNDAGELRFTPDGAQAWNADDALFLIPSRRPPWIQGGNRAGWHSLHAGFAGEAFWRFGASLRSGRETRWEAWVTHEDAVVAREGGLHRAEPFAPGEIGTLATTLKPGLYRFHLRVGEAKREWPYLAVAREPLMTDCPFTTPGDVTDAPFWRECVQEFWPDPLWARLPWHEEWAFWLDLATPESFSEEWLDAHHPKWQPVLGRVDTRTYRRSHYLVRTPGGWLTTLRLEGGEGMQPFGLARNSVAQAFVRALAAEA